MGKASSSKKVARAASTGGGRTNRGRTPVLYYGALFIIAALGFTGIAVSRGAGKANAKVPPTTADHWHAAFGFYFCDQFAAAPGDKAGDLYGIHTHADGLIHIHPFSSRTTGKNATLGAIITDIGGTLSETRVGIPGHKTMKNGDKCGKDVGKVRVIVWDNAAAKKGKPVAGDPKSLRLKNGEIITTAFAPANKDIPKPPSAKDVANPGDLGTTPTPTPTTVAGNSSSTTTPAASSTTATTLR
ncbi:MAG: hypothetical protein QOG03_317 [Actinomycetota bacterium]|jgi:hypothetical protein|nr:hypothetical protein [Actinomycetota bacterium]